MTDCLFCKIVNRDIPCKLAHEDEHILAFHDIRPQAPTHVLIIPKHHVATLNDANPLLLGQLLSTAQQLAKKTAIAEPGYRIVINCNPAGGQEVYHLHLHLLAGRQLTWPPG